MAKQKNRLTTTRPQNRLARERFAYPAPTLHIQQTVGDETRTLLTLDPTLDHISRPNRNLATTKLAYPTPLASRFDSVRSASPENRPPDRSNLSCLPWTYPGPPSLWSAREPTSNWTKTNQPTLDRIHHTSSTGRPSNRSSNRPCPSSLPYTVQHTAAHDRASQTRRIRINRIPPSPTRLPCTARPETTHRKTHNPYKSPEIRRTHWGNRGEGRLTLSRS